MSNDNNDYLALLDDICKDLHSSIETIRCAENNTQHRYVLALYCSIIDFAKAFQTLAARYLFIALPAIERSFFEAYVDFKNLFIDQNYYSQMLYENNKQKLRLMKDLKKREPNNKRLLDEIVKIQEDMDRAPQNSKNISERFKLAGLEDVYKLVYGPLCAETHNNLIALRNRYLIKDKTSYRVTLDKQNASFPKQRVINLKRMVNCLKLAYCVLQGSIGTVDNKILNKFGALHECLVKLEQAE